MSFSRSMMKPIKWFIIGFCYGMIPYVNLKREYFAVGGEIFLPFIPLVLFGIPSFIKEFKELFEGGDVEND